MRDRGLQSIMAEFVERSNVCLRNVNDDGLFLG